MLFWAVLLTAVDVPIALPGGGSIDLVPDWLGLALLSRTAGTLAGESIRFRQLQRWSTGLCAWAGCVWLAKIALGGGIPLIHHAYTWLLLWLLYLLVEALHQTEQRREAALGAAWLRRCFRMLAVCTVLQVYPVFLGDILPDWVSFGLGIGQLLALVLFLRGIWSAEAKYQEMAAFSPGKM